MKDRPKVAKNRPKKVWTLDKVLLLREPREEAWELFHANRDAAGVEMLCLRELKTNGQSPKVRQWAKVQLATLEALFLNPSAPAAELGFPPDVARRLDEEREKEERIVQVSHGPETVRRLEREEELLWRPLAEMTASDGGCEVSPFDRTLDVHFPRFREYLLKNQEARQLFDQWEKEQQALATIRNEKLGPARDAAERIHDHDLETRNEMMNKADTKLAVAERHVAKLRKPAKAGEQMFKAQAQRRAEWSRRRREAWAKWQAWIDDQRRKHKWSLLYAQRQAATYFNVSPKSIKRRTKETGTA